MYELSLILNRTAMQFLFEKITKRENKIKSREEEEEEESRNEIKWK